MVSATLTLLGLLIGFTFSMATARYDQRRLYEESEANAIGTEYVRADLMPADQGAQVQGLLRRYLHTRIDFYQSDYGSRLDRVNDESVALQGQMWAAIRPLAQQQPTPVTALVVSGMNDVLNSSGYTQFSYWNRIPVAAWTLMVVVALISNALVGYATNPRDAIGQAAAGGAAGDRRARILSDRRHRQSARRRDPHSTPRPEQPGATAAVGGIHITAAVGGIHL